MTGSPAPRAAARTLRGIALRRSLRLRLALWCGSIVCSVVTLEALYGYAIHSRTNYDELDGQVRKVTEHVTEELLRATNSNDRAQVLAGALGLGVRVALYDSAGRTLSAGAPSDALSPSAALPVVNPRRVLSGTPRAPYGLLETLAPAVHDTVPNRGSFGLVTNGPSRWRVYVLPLNGLVLTDGSVARYLVGIAALSDLDSSLRRVWLFMIWVAVLGNIVTFVTAWVLAGRALHPVLALTEAASTIARSGALSERVPANMPRDELGRLAETFNELLERLERAQAVQSRFVSDASHELRAPLTVIQANLELLAHRPAMASPERATAVREAHAEAARLSRLVADLLVLARADAGVPLRLEPVELDRVVMDVIGAARHLALHLHLEIATLDPVVVSGSADQLKQLVLNLVENATSNTPADGRVTVTLRRVNAVAEIEVRDTGIGISADDLPRVFERFYRADPARSRDAGGTGLGLSIALWIAQQHGGDIVIASERGRGTIATVRLPVSS